MIMDDLSIDTEEALEIVGEMLNHGCMQRNQELRI